MLLADSLQSYRLNNWVLFALIANMTSRYSIVITIMKRSNFRTDASSNSKGPERKSRTERLTWTGNSQEGPQLDSSFVTLSSGRAASCYDLVSTSLHGCFEIGKAWKDIQQPHSFLVWLNDPAKIYPSRCRDI